MENKVILSYNGLLGLKIMKFFLFETEFGHVWISQPFGNEWVFLQIFQDRIKGIQLQKLQERLPVYYPWGLFLTMKRKTIYIYVIH